MGGPPSDPTSLPPPLPAGVAWQDVWLHALVDKSAVLTLRRALDDAHLPAAPRRPRCRARGGSCARGGRTAARPRRVERAEASGSLHAGSNGTGDVAASAADTLSQQRAVEASAARRARPLACAAPLASQMAA